MDEDIMETEIKETFYLNQANKNYKLIMVLNSKNITLNISNMNKFMQSYQITLNLEQLKEKHETFSNIKSLQEFFDKIKDSIEKKEIIINKKYDNLISIEFKKNKIFFELIKERIDLDKLVENINIMKDKYNMKISDIETKFNGIYNENKNMKNEIDELNRANEILVKRIKKLKEKVKNIKGIKNIIEENNKKIKDLNEKFIKQEKVEIKQNEEILKLSKDIQEIKKIIYEIKIKKDLLRLESLEKNINRININRNEKESLNNYTKDLYSNINNIEFEEKKKIKINNMKEFKENSKGSDSELNEHSILEQKYKLLKLKDNKKYYNNNFRTNTRLTFERNFNKTPQKGFRDILDINLNRNMQKNMLPPINTKSNSIKKQNKMFITQKEFYPKKENLIEEAHENINETIRNTFYANVNDYNNKIQNWKIDNNFKRNFINNNEEIKENYQNNFPKEDINLKKNNLELCFLF